LVALLGTNEHEIVDRACRLPAARDWWRDLIPVPAWYYRAVAARSIAIFVVLIGGLYCASWAWSHYLALTSIFAIVRALRMGWAMTGPAYYKFLGDAVIIVTSDDPDPDVKRFTYIPASWIRRRAVRLTESSARGGPAVTILLDNGRVIIVPVGAKDFDLALSDMAHAYKVNADDIYRLDSVPGQWPPPPKPGTAPKRRSGAG
jgi:hypothetical protein